MKEKMKKAIETIERIVIFLAALVTIIDSFNS